MSNNSENLLFKSESVWKKRSREEIEKFSSEYSGFLTNSKTERLTVKNLVSVAKKLGFSDDIFSDRFYVINKDKTVAFFKITDNLEDGFNIITAHIDSPRIDLKPRFLFEDDGILLLKTHYYGGIKKYQWFNIPLCLKGVVLKTDGSLVEVSIGDAPGEPVLVISDLLPHLDKEDKKVSEKFLGEDLSPIAGTIPLENEEKEAVKLYVLKLLNEKYGVTEKDLIGADLSLVPAFETRGAGLDSSLIAGYGHDDRVCAYTAFRAIIDSKSQKRSSIVLLFDREEIGSDGNTGAKERFWIRVLKKIVEHNNPNLDVEDLIEKSAVLSGDVAAGLDPKYKTVMEPLNAPKLGYGTVLVKYTGVRGKSGTSEASAEFFGKIRNLFIENDVSWQVGELGKVDQGGGGTVAKFFAELGSWVLDVGPAVLGMHSPYELVSKADVLETYLAYKTFLENFSG
ncbi:MAG: hypothetical protein PWQ20_332 [Thermotogaceae bacterium]|jgi:aspartyl aminopeptidase|nr:hypothetical protein [Thermotogaceae bacterium]MDN5337262.1 hypothetical protein [Thermotogaceae bacterium]